MAQGFTVMGVNDKTAEEIRKEAGRIAGDQPARLKPLSDNEMITHIWEIYKGVQKAADNA